MIVVKLEARPMAMAVLNFDLFTVYFRWDTLTAIQDRMNRFYENLEVGNESEEKANKVRDIIEGIIEEVVSKDYEETVIISASENVLSLDGAVKLGKDRLHQQNESGYLSELEASVCVS